MNWWDSLRMHLGTLSIKFIPARFEAFSSNELKAQVRRRQSCSRPWWSSIAPRNPKLRREMWTFFYRFVESCATELNPKTGWLLRAVADGRRLYPRAIAGAEFPHVRLPKRYENDFHSLLLLTVSRPNISTTQYPNYHPFQSHAQKVQEVVRIGSIISSSIWVSYEKPSSSYCVMLYCWWEAAGEIWIDHSSE